MNEPAPGRQGANFGPNTIGLLPAEQCSFRRREGRWHLRLVSTDPADSARRTDSIAVAELVGMVVGGMVQAGIGDATVWGVHRFARDLLARICGATFAEPITPFVFATAFALHSGGRVRPMRRRRLRWDCADGSIPVRGKRGWVDRVATIAGCR